MDGGQGRLICHRSSRRLPLYSFWAVQVREPGRPLIVEGLNASGYRLPPAAEISVITRQTRSEEMPEISTPTVRAAQAAQLSAAEHRELRGVVAAARQRGPLLDGSNGGTNKPAETTREQMALGSAVAHRFERASVLKGHEVLAEALNAGLGKLDLQKLKQEVRAGSAGLVALEKDGTGNAELSARFATSRGVALGKWSVGFVNAGKGTCPSLLPGRVQVAAWLAEEQKEAVRFVGASRDQVMAIRGVAGAGKTTLLKELNSHLAVAKHNLLYLAPTAATLKVLQSEGFTKATTVSEYLAKTQDRAMPPEWKGAVIVVDEAGLGVYFLLNAVVCLVTVYPVPLLGFAFHRSPATSLP